MINGNTDNITSLVRNIKGAVEVGGNTSIATKTGTYIEITDLPIGTTELTPEFVRGWNDGEILYNHGKNLIPSDYRKFSMYEDKYFTLPKLPVGATMTISHETELGETQYVYFYEVIDGVKEFLCRLTTNRVVINSFTFTVKENATYQLFATSQAAIDAIVNLQLEVGTERTEYVEYVEPYWVDYYMDTSEYQTIGVHSGYNLLYTSLGSELVIDYEASANEVFNHDGDLISFTVDRIGESKFFGFGVSQKANIRIRDIERKYSFETGAAINLKLDNKVTMPIFYVTETHRDENTNELSITAYDALYSRQPHTVNEVGKANNYIGEFAIACGNLLGLDVVIPELECFNAYYENGANFEGTETIREALNAVAEATQTIYFVNHENKLEFKRLDITGDPVFTISKDLYISLDSKTNRRLSAICSVTDLGDNVEARLDISGTTQYVRNNPFWDLNDNIGTLLDSALEAVGGLTINQFYCDWRGNYYLEIGDKIALVTKDNETVISYFLNDTITYDGALSQSTQWEYADAEETASNPSSLGEMLKQTYARVDKANKEVIIVAKRVDANEESIATINLNTDSISTSVGNLDKKIDDKIDGVNDNITELSRRVNATMTDEEVKLEIETAIANGVDKVTTATGFTFNDTGLTVSKSDSEIKTTITEDGMSVYKNSAEVLTANNEGVTAIDLKAKTFLVIGDYSRLQNYPNKTRTACFWIGG